MSSALALYSIANTALAIISPALGPGHMCERSYTPEKSTRTNNVASQNSVGFLFDDKLDYTLAIRVGLGTRVGGKWELADLLV